MKQDNHDRCNTRNATTTKAAALKDIVLTLMLAVLPIASMGQVSLDECIEKTMQNYPTVKQYDLIEQSAAFSFENAKRAYIPQLSVSAKASYQSEATTFPFEIPGLGITGLPKDQYQILADIRQVIWDGGEIKVTKDLVKANASQSARQLDTDLYQLRERVMGLFFGILMLEKQIEQNEALHDNLQRNLDMLKACYDNGTATQSDVDAVQVELLDTEQQTANMTKTREAYIGMLSIFTGETYDRQTTFVLPSSDTGVRTDNIARPELALIDAQMTVLGFEDKKVKTGFRPKLSLFFQGGYGNPGLDLLKDKFRAYYVAGVNLSWNFGKLYTLKNERKSIDTRRMMLDTQREAFITNTRMSVVQTEKNIEAINEQLARDEEIVRLRTRIRQAAEASHMNGTMSVTDMLTEINKEHIARLMLECRKIELVKEKYELKHIVNG